MKIQIHSIDNSVMLRPMGACRFVNADQFIVRIDDREIIVPKGFETDLGSIPRLFRPLLSVASAPIPFLVHDFLYSQAGSEDASRDYADCVMLALMQYYRTPKWGWQRRLAYWGVRAGGWIAYSKHRKRNRNESR